jgi:ribonuclease D
VLALDTEFVRERTYFARLGLVQLSDGHTVWLLDPLAEGTLAPLAEVLADPGVTKLLHSPSEDLEVLLKVVGALPEPLVDTQVACALLGQPLQLGYHKAAEWLLDVSVDKDQTRSDWCARPLKPAQLHYAALDVCVLPMMWELLGDRLETLDRRAWLAEDCERQLAIARKPVEPTESWRRIRGHGRLDGSALAILQALAEWREHRAMQRDLPRGFVVPDKALLSLADGGLGSRDKLESVPGVHPKVLRRHADEWLDMARIVREEGRTLPVPPRLSTAQKKTVGRLRDVVSAQARELELEPVLLASRRELEEWVVAGGRQWPGRLDGWRREQLGAAFDALRPGADD